MTLPLPALWPVARWCGLRCGFCGFTAVFWFAFSQLFCPMRDLLPKFSWFSGLRLYATTLPDLRRVRSLFLQTPLRTLLTYYMTSYYLFCLLTLLGVFTNPATTCGVVRFLLLPTNEHTTVSFPLYHIYKQTCVCMAVSYWRIHWRNLILPSAYAWKMKNKCIIKKKIWIENIRKWKRKY